MTDQAKWDRRTLAQRVAADIPGGSYVNLGIGMPTAVPDYVEAQREIVFHSENGILGVGPKPPPGSEDWDLVNAGKECVTLVPGSAILSHSDSFALIRGGHLDLVVMGGLQVSGSGDLANWSSGTDGVPAVGGAMDLAVGARQVWVMMQLLAPDGSSKLVPECTYPLTAKGVVRRLYSDMGIFEFEPEGPVVTDMPDGVTPEDLEGLTGLRLRPARVGRAGGSEEAGSPETDLRAAAQGRHPRGSPLCIAGPVDIFYLDLVEARCAKPQGVVARSETCEKGERVVHVL